MSQPTGTGTTSADTAAPGLNDPDQIAVAAAGCPGVVRLAPGPLATYLPGRTVPGVAVRDGTVVVAVVAAYGPPLPQTAERVRAAVRRVAPNATVDVRVDDVELPGERRDE